VAVYETAGVNAEERGRVAKAQELLRKLPADAPAAVKQSVEATFMVLGIPTTKIVAAASKEIEALNAFIEHGEEESKRIRADSVRKIAELEAKITEVKATMARSIAEQDERGQAAADEILKVQPVVEFFKQGGATDDSPESFEVQIEQTQDGT
jgi:hypothetical protein